MNYDECPLLPDFTPDYDLIAEKARTATVVHIQRSRGYTQRNAFDLATIQKVADTAREANPDAVIFVDNCYGEFTQTQEPCRLRRGHHGGQLHQEPRRRHHPHGRLHCGPQGPCGKVQPPLQCARHRRGPGLHAGHAP